MSPLTAEQAGDNFVRDNTTAEDVDYFEKRDLSQVDFSAFPQRYIRERNDRSFVGVSLRACALLCRYDADCKSFDYVDNQNCFLSKSSRHDVPAEDFPTRADVTHYEKLNLDTEEVTGLNTINWVDASFEVYPGAYIIGKNDVQVVQAVSVRGCAWLCLDTAACQSFDYSVALGCVSPVW
jgi:hypothetical protein